MMVAVVSYATPLMDGAFGSGFVSKITFGFIIVILHQVPRFKPSLTSAMCKNLKVTLGTRHQTTRRNKAYSL